MTYKQGLGYVSALFFAVISGILVLAEPFSEEFRAVPDEFTGCYERNNIEIMINNTSVTVNGKSAAAKLGHDKIGEFIQTNPGITFDKRNEHTGISVIIIPDDRKSFRIADGFLFTYADGGKIRFSRREC